MKNFFSAFLLLLLPYFVQATPPIRVGETLSNAALNVQNVSLVRDFDAITQDKALILAFLPSDKPDTPYGETVFNAFKYYFAQGLAFTPEERANKKVLIYFIVKSSDISPLNPTKFEGIHVISDPDGKFFTRLGVRIPQHATEDATVLVLDKNKTVQYISEHYRGEGEKLKPLELVVKRTLNVETPQVAQSNSPEISPLREGDAAPDFTMEDGSKLSDYRGKKAVVVAFYPAPFSGVVRFDQARSNLRSVNPKMAMGCAGEIKTIDSSVQNRLYAEGGANAPAILMVSGSTTPILAKWQAFLKTQSTTLINDADYRISSLYQSYNAEGYNNRTVFVVDKEGKLAYIDWEYDVANGQDLRLLQQKMASLK